MRGLKAANPPTRLDAVDPDINLLLRDGGQFRQKKSTPDIRKHGTTFSTFRSLFSGSIRTTETIHLNPVDDHGHPYPLDGYFFCVSEARAPQMSLITYSN